MKKTNEKSLQALYEELYQIDELLQTKKNERHEELQNKAEKLNEQFLTKEDDPETVKTKHALLDEYKEQLNELLGINELRGEREKIKDQIWEKERQNDAKTEVNFMQ
jgi:DNA repair exonuclease SbcCD ATPase subunit